MKRFVRRGDDVVIKPNICTGYHGPEYAATTNPVVVGTLVALCRRAGAGRVRVMDSPFGGPADEAYEVSGIAAAVDAGRRRDGAHVTGEVRRVPDPGGPGHLELADLPRRPRLRRPHRRTNRQGPRPHAALARRQEPARRHPRSRSIHSDIGQRTADLVSVCRPTLTVVDAVRILTANGPTGGDLADVEKLDTVIAGADIVAADSYAATLFGLTGEEVPYVRAAAAMGLGEIDLDRVDVRRVRA